MTWLMKLYSLALRLYPRSFRDRFAGEMEDVFRAGLQEAFKQDAAVSYMLREALRMPGSLLDVYAWSIRTGGERQIAISGAGGGAAGGTSLGEGWAASLLAGLPNLVMGIFIVSSMLISEAKAVDENAFGYVWIAVMSLLLLAVLFFSLFKGWRRWSASWLIYMFIFSVILLSLAANLLASSLTGNDAWTNTVQMMFLPLLLAYLLYKIACADRLRGLLAALPPMALFWSFFQEFVPALPKALAWGWMFMLAFGASVLMLRTPRFTAALALAMLVPVLGGFPFTYQGVYMGGTLPFSEPGPSFTEVWRQYLPFLAAVLSIALGPQLAAKLRALGETGAAGKIFYRLALGGVLLASVLTLLHWVNATGEVPQWMRILLANWPIWLAASLVLYLAGFAYFLWAPLFFADSSDDHPAVLKAAALFLLLPGVPLVIFLVVPDVPLRGFQYGWLISAVEIVWALAAACFVMDHEQIGPTP